jgi:hypothetical protein
MLLLGGQTPGKELNLGKEPETILRKIAKVFAQEDEIQEASLDPNVEINQYGGKQARLDGDFIKLSPQFLLALAKLVKQGGDKYGEFNWLKITTGEHLNHALTHIFEELSGDPSSEEDHLLNAACRLMFAWVAKNQVGGTENKSGHIFPTMP